MESRHMWIRFVEAVPLEPRIFTSDDSQPREKAHEIDFRPTLIVAFTLYTYRAVGKSVG